MQMKRLVLACAVLGSTAGAVVVSPLGLPLGNFTTDYFESETGAAHFDASKPTRQAVQLFNKNQNETRAVLLMQDGQPILRRYAEGYSDRTRFISWSMAKSVTAVLVGELVADGKLKLDAPVPFAEWQKPGDPQAAITLRQMLHMSSGLDHAEGLDPALGPEGALKSDTTQALFVHGDKPMAAYTLAKGMEAKPGAKYEYSSLTSLLLAELITRQLTDSKDARRRLTRHSPKSGCSNPQALPAPSWSSKAQARRSAGRSSI
jgi:CubicO group peptidase (beta-lactamase class C family)